MSDLAQRLIAENQLTKAKFLDLGNCGLTAIPAEVAQMDWLEGPNLGAGWSSWSSGAWRRRRTENQGDQNRIKNVS